MREDLRLSFDERDDFYIELAKTKPPALALSYRDLTGYAHKIEMIWIEPHKNGLRIVDTHEIWKPFITDNTLKLMNYSGPIVYYEDLKFVNWRHKLRPYLGGFLNWTLRDQVVVGDIIANHSFASALMHVYD